MTALVVIAGLCLGSFLNVVIHRLPKGRSVVHPGSRCPQCRHAIAFYDNIPVLSWVLLGGRCRSCKARISGRYPLVEVLTAALTWGLWVRGGGGLWAALTVLAAGALIAAAFIDWDTFLIPDEISLGLLAAGLLVSPVNPFFARALGEGAWYGRMLHSLIGAATGFGICWVTAEVGERLFKREALGGGDFKLLAGIGAWTGALGAFDCMMVGAFAGSVYGISRMAAGTLKRYEPMPFGPFLSAAAVFNFFVLLPFGFPFAPI
ncbi:MAG: prepilin peptidase [Elusimicrobiota bacterium]|jgi:leader peptidase (prepilin peptidase)/N-methyltransferase